MRTPTDSQLRVGSQARSSRPDITSRAIRLSSPYFSLSSITMRTVPPDSRLASAMNAATWSSSTATFEGDPERHRSRTLRTRAIAATGCEQGCGQERYEDAPAAHSLDSTPRVSHPYMGPPPRSCSVSTAARGVAQEDHPDVHVASRPVAVAAAVTTAAAGAVGVVLARAHPQTTLFAGTPSGALLGACAATALAIAVALRDDKPFLGTAGLTAALAMWRTPDTSSAVVFTTGLVTVGAAAAIVATALLVDARGRLPLLPYGLLAAACACLPLGTGLLGTLAFDPPRDGCAGCPDNLLSVGLSHRVLTDAAAFGLRVGGIGLAATVAVALLRLVRASPQARAASAPVTLPAVAFVALVVLEIRHTLALDRVELLQRPRPTCVSTWRRRRRCCSSPSASRWRATAPRRSRARVARLVLSAMESGDTDVTAALRRALGDAGARIVYRVGEERSAVAADGSPVSAEPDDGEVATPLLRDGHVVAQVVHAAALAEDPVRLDGAIAGLRATIEHERLAAEARALVDDLRRSRQRIVAAADRERRRIERDLHDGAQQQIIALLYEVGLERAREPRGRGYAPRGRAARHGCVPARRARADPRDRARRLSGTARLRRPPCSRRGPRRPRPDALPAHRSATRTASARRGGGGVHRRRRVDPRRALRVDRRALRRRRARARDRRPRPRRGYRGRDERRLDDRVSALGGRFATNATADGGTIVLVRLPCGS